MHLVNDSGKRSRFYRSAQYKCIFCFIASSKEVMILPGVCLSVCLSVSYFT